MSKDLCQSFISPYDTDDFVLNIEFILKVVSFMREVTHLMKDMFGRRAKHKKSLQNTEKGCSLDILKVPTLDVLKVHYTD